MKPPGTQHASRRSAGSSTAAPPDDLRTRVNIVVALRAEADPLIDRFQLRGSRRNSSFRVWESDDEVFRVVVSGVGKVAAAAATAEVATLGRAAWINVGVAGHRRHSLATPLLAHRLTDAATARRWFPPFVFDPPCDTAALTTVDRARTEFPDDELYDMEASGFYEIATRNATAELVHCLKIVSDNSDHPAARLTPERAGELVYASMLDVTAVLHIVSDLAEEQAARTAAPRGVARIAGMARFSVTRQHQLADLLRRWEALYADDDVVAWTRALKLTDAGAILERIAAHLDAHELPVRRP